MQGTQSISAWQILFAVQDRKESQSSVNVQSVVLCLSSSSGSSTTCGVGGLNDAGRTRSSAVEVSTLYHWVKWLSYECHYDGSHMTMTLTAALSCRGTGSDTGDQAPRSHTHDELVPLQEKFSCSEMSSWQNCSEMLLLLLTNSSSTGANIFIENYLISLHCPRARLEKSISVLQQASYLRLTRKDLWP